MEEQRDEIQDAMTEDTRYEMTEAIREEGKETSQEETTGDTQEKLKENARQEMKPDRQAENDWIETMAPAEVMETMGTAMNTLGTALGNLEAILSGVERSLTNLQSGRRAFNRMGLGAAVLLPVTLIIQMALAVVLNLAVPGWNETWVLWLASLLPMYLIATPLALRIMGTVPASPPEDHPLDRWRIAALVPVTLLLSYAGNAAALLITALWSRLTGLQTENALADLLMEDNAPVLRCLMLVWASPILEEYVFRKTILDRIRRYGERLAVVVSALLFGLVHGNFIQFCYAFLLGLLFGYVYLRTGRLRYTIGLHVLVNFMGSVLSPLVLRYAGAKGTAGGSVVMLVFSVVLLLICGGGVAILAENWRQVRFFPAEGELPRGTWFRTAFANPGMMLTAASCVMMFVLTQIL